MSYGSGAARVCIFAIAYTLVVPLVEAQESDLQATFGSSDMISLAAGYQQSSSAAPATVTVVTRADIDRLNPLSLTEILNHVAGFHLVPAPDGRGTVVVERGRVRNVLFMLDSVPYVNGLVFEWQNIDDALPYDIERIEILRGPASAVYGADASGGVVNIITRSGRGVAGLKAGARVGSFASRDIWLDAGTRVDEAAISVYVGYRSTDETHATIGRDAQTSYDEVFGTHASMAPGRLAGTHNVLQLQVNALVGSWRISAAEFAETNFHTGAGISESLDPNGFYDQHLGTLNATYHSIIAANLELNGFLSYSHLFQGAHVDFFPPGAFGDFPDGVRDGLRDHEDRERVEFSLLRRELRRHDVLLGVGGIYDDFALDQDIRNFIIRGSRIVPTGVYAPGAGVGDPLAIGRTSLQAWYVYIQDEWHFAPDWSLTTGVRWDRYWSFGSTFNPRAALVWSATDKWSVKLLYTSAFTPPNETQSHSNGIFYGLGNPNLQPERSHAVDLGVTWEESQLKAELTLYRYHDTSLIQLLPSTSSVNGLEYLNQGYAKGWGLESALKYRPLEGGIVLSGSYALHETIGNDEAASQEVALAARHQVSTELTVPLSSVWTINLNTLSLLGRTRPSGDPRPTPASYTLVGADLGWRSKGWRGGDLDMRIGAKNLTNSGAREPDSTPQGIYYDIPLPGRELYATLEYRY
jgi:outer membrane receptor for ferrienterochelin and colicins